jgi:hypothetical protein
VIRDIDRVLGADDSDLPPMRRADGSLVELRVVEPFDLHQLASDGSNGEADPAKGGFLPAPPEPLLVEMTPITTRLMISARG